MIIVPVRDDSSTRLPHVLLMLVGTLVDWTEHEPTEDEPNPETIRARVTGIRWERNVDGNETGRRCVELMLDRGDGTMRWVGPFGL